MWSFTIPASTFDDVDGDILILSAMLADGSDLPSWLSFDPATGTFLGIPPQDFNGVFDLRVTASDGIESVVTNFSFNIQAVNDAPVIVTPITNQTIQEDQSWNYTIPEGSFIDVEGDELTFSVSLADGSALPAWLSFDANTQTFSGTPPQDFNGSFDIRVSASDGQEVTTTDFSLIIDPVNDAPILISAIESQNTDEDAAWSYTIPESTFTDVDGDALTLSASLADGSALPAWLSFDANTQTFSGTPPQDFNGSLVLKVTASDTIDSISLDFTLTINPIEDAPIVLTPISNQNIAEDTIWAYTLPAATFADGDGDALTLSASLADGSALPSWLSFDANTQTFSGTPSQDFNGAFDIRVSASDGQEVITTDFTLTIDAVNDAPILISAIESQNTDEDAAWSYTIPESTFTDVDGDALTLSATLADGSALPSWLSFDAETQTFTGTPPQDFNGSFDLRVTASDGLESIATDFTLTIDALNDVPVVVTSIVDQSSNEDAAWSYTIPESTFTDVDGDALTLSASLADGSALPSWLSFDANTQTFSGTPPQDFNGSFDLRVTASDGLESIATDFSLIIDPVNDTPIVITPVANQSSDEDTAWAYSIPASTFADVDGDALTLSASLADGSALPSWLSFDANTQTFSGTPSQDFNGAFDIRVSASDGQEVITTDFTLTIDAVNDAPILISAIESQNTDEDAAWSYTIPESTFADVDGDALTLSASLADGSAFTGLAQL